MEEIMNNINYSKNKIKLLDNADVVVIGGGTAGVVAAISALKENKTCIIIEKANALGGIATNGLVIPFMNSFVNKQDGLNVELNREFLEFDKK